MISSSELYRGMTKLNTLASNSTSAGSRIETILLVALILRIFMVFFGSRVLDVSAHDLKYTDIDYNIFTDAAQLIISGDIFAYWSMKFPYLLNTFAFTAQQLLMATILFNFFYAFFIICIFFSLRPFFSFYQHNFHLFISFHLP